MVFLRPCVIMGSGFGWVSKYFLSVSSLRILLSPVSTGSGACMKASIGFLVACGSAFHFAHTIDI